MREQAQHVVLVRWQIDCLVDGEGEVVGEVAPIAKIAHPRGTADKKKRRNVCKHGQGILIN